MDEQRGRQLGAKLWNVFKRMALPPWALNMNALAARGHAIPAT
jgi:ABC-type sulfate transport system permease subunit